MTIHTFGAYFGLFLSRVLYRSQLEKSKHRQSSVYNSDLFAMIGEALLRKGAGPAEHLALGRSSGPALLWVLPTGSRGACDLCSSLPLTYDPVLGTHMSIPGPGVFPSPPQSYVKLSWPTRPTCGAIPTPCKVLPPPWPCQPGPPVLEFASSKNPFSSQPQKPALSGRKSGPGSPRAQ